MKRVLPTLCIVLCLVACATRPPEPSTPAAEPAPPPPAPAAEPAATATSEETPLPEAPGGLASMNAELISTALRTYFVAQEEPLAEEPTEEPPVLITPAQAVEMALARNPTVDIAQSEVGAARARIGQARSRALPQVQGQAAATYIDEPDFDIGGGGPLGGRLIERVVGDIGGDSTTTIGQVSVRQVLFAGGQIQAAIRASRFLAESEEWRRQATLDQLAFDTRQAYYNVLLARALERVAQESVVTFERHLADAERMYDVGLISGFEVLRARTELGTRRSDAVSAANGVRLAKANLRRLLALPPDTPVRLTGGPALEPVGLPAGALVALAREHRPELLALEQGIRAAEANVDRVRGQYWPQVAAQAQYSETDGGMSFGTGQGFTANVGAQMDLYAGGRRHHELVEARENLAGVRAQYADVTNLVELDVTRAYIQLQDAAAQVESEMGNVELAREGLRLAELRFQEGVGTQAETLDASLALTGAETALVRALNEYAVAYAGLQRAVSAPLEPVAEK